MATGSTKPQCKFRKPYDASIPTRTYFPLSSLVKTSFQAECNINTIMAKYEATGIIEHARSVSGAYGDFEGLESYHEAQNRVLDAQDAFMALPAPIRRRFDNEPGKFLEFMSDDANEAEAIQLGLIPSKPLNIPAEGQESKPAEPLKAVEPEGSKSSPAGPS